MQDSVLISQKYGGAVGRASDGLASAAGQRLKSEIVPLDRLFDGGLPLGTVSEWGVPLGSGGRQVILAFLAQATCGNATRAPWWCLWVRPTRADLMVYPPAWHAAGVDLGRVRFATSARPVDDLKPALADPFFKLVVFDEPERLTDADVAYLSREARRLGRLVLVLQSRWLKAERGTVWAKTRVNCWREGDEQGQAASSAPRDGFYRVETVRGLRSALIKFKLDAFSPLGAMERPT